MSMAMRLYERFLDTKAPLEVNLPADVFALYRVADTSHPGSTSTMKARLTHEDFTATYFDEAAKSVLAMMQMDSLPRFKRANKEMWAHFLKEKEEMKMLNTLSASMKTTSRSTATVTPLFDTSDTGESAADIGVAIPVHILPH